MHEGVWLNGDDPQLRRKVPQVGAGAAPDLHQGARKAGEEIPFSPFHERVIVPVTPGHEPGHETIVEAASLGQAGVLFDQKWRRDQGRAEIKLKVRPPDTQTYGKYAGTPRGASGFQ